MQKKKGETFDETIFFFAVSNELLTSFMRFWTSLSMFERDKVDAKQRKYQNFNYCYRV